MPASEEIYVQEMYILFPLGDLSGGGAVDGGGGARAPALPPGQPIMGDDGLGNFLKLMTRRCQAPFYLHSYM